MVSPRAVAAFHADYDKHPGDRVELFRAVASAVDPSGRVLYDGSYVDIAPSVWFDDVVYLDLDKRAPRFFAEAEQVRELVEQMRSSVGRSGSPTITFLHGDYREPQPIADGSIDVLVSLYAGFISEHCTRYLRPGGCLVVNNSHGDASMATLLGRYRLHSVIVRRDDTYRVRTEGLDRYLVPKSGREPTIDELHEAGRGVAYTTQPFAYVFELAGRTSS